VLLGQVISGYARRCYDKSGYFWLGLDWSVKVSLCQVMSA